jgi:hypothetical protein
MSASISKLSGYAVLLPQDGRVSKLSAYAILAPKDMRVAKLSAYAILSPITGQPSTGSGVSAQLVGL